VNRFNRVRHQIRLRLRAQNTVPVFIGLILLWAAGLPGLADVSSIESARQFTVANPADDGPTIARIRRRGYLIVGIQTQVRPLSFGAEPQGLEIELAQQLALGLLGQASAVRFVPLLHRDRLPALQDGRVDLVIAGLTRTHARQRLIRMTAPYYFDGLGVIVPKSVTGLRGSGPIAVLQGSEAIAVVKSRWPQATLVAVESYAAAYQALESGQAQAFVGDRSVLIGWQQEFPQYRCLDDRLSSAPLAIGLAKGQDDLALALDRQLVQLGPWLKTAAQRWGLP
jgi:polar amino acid transport system substrate-binding protein